MTLEIQVLACDRHKNVNSGTYAIRHLSFLSSCDILQQNYGLKVSLLTKIKPENSDMLYNPTHFPGPLVCWIRQVLLYMYMKSTYNSYKFSSFVVFFLFIGFQMGSIHIARFLDFYIMFCRSLFVFSLVIGLTGAVDVIVQQLD